MKKYCLLITLIFYAISPSKAESVKIMSWNIANLSSEFNIPLRGHSRAQKQYNQIKKTISVYNPDILALQEMGSLAAVEKIINPNDYMVVMESRCYENESKCSKDNDDIYTAIAFKKNIDGTKPFQLPSLAIGHENECGEVRKVRGGVGVSVNINGKRTHIVSVHLKASCKDDQIEPGTQDDCDTQEKQVNKLLEWVKSVPSNEAIIVAGDFNRKLLKDNDSIRSKILAERDPQILPAQNRICWSGKEKGWYKPFRQEAIDTHEKFDGDSLSPRIYDPGYNRAIDFFVVYGMDEENILSEQLSMKDIRSLSNPSPPLTSCSGETIFFGNGENQSFSFLKANPSDHCPIVIKTETEKLETSHTKVKYKANLIEIIGSGKNKKLLINGFSHQFRKNKHGYSLYYDTSNHKNLLEAAKAFLDTQG